jgi:ABC-type polysaccharide/polyol phosphate transport system ATPase subunit
MAIIEVEHLTKEFRLGQLQSVAGTLKRMAARLRREHVERPAKFKALSDINFEVAEGEVLGIIGHNGAGKSTLLKILSRITTPTTGRVAVRGKVAPLIEVGAGLVGDLTGRENIYLNASILGMSRSDTRKRFDEIVSFAELEKFIDTPLKRYSSGMQIRLGFAIATAVDTDIIIVDEVLAVGDLAFQRKSFDRMESLIRNQGKTVLVVGHNLRQLERLCSRIIVLDKGRVLIDGDPAVASKKYIELSSSKIREQVASTARTGHDQVIRSGELEVDAVELYSGTGPAPTKDVAIGSTLRVGVQFRANRDLDHLEVVVGFHTPDFVYIAAASTVTLGLHYSATAGSHYLECGVDDFPLLPGVYAVRLSFLDKNSRPIWYGENLSVFTVTSGHLAPSQLPVLGFIKLNCSWKARPEGAGPLAPLAASMTPVARLVQVRE